MKTCDNQIVPAKPARKHWRHVAVIAATLLVGWIGLHRVLDREPRHEGRPLTQWLAASEANRKVSNDAEYERAINAIGTNGIPTLLKLLSVKDHYGAALQPLVDRMGWTKFHGFDSTYNPRLAAVGFRILGQTAKSATPKLIELARTGPSSLTRTYALWCLEEMKSDKQILLPLWTQALADTDPEVARFAAERLYQFDPNEAQKAGAGKFLPFPIITTTNVPAIQ
jgi:hypothetical protein